MRRAPFTLLAGLCLAMVTPWPVSAQDASPGSGGIAIADADGVVHGTITIREVADPFAAYEPTQPPPEGQRFVQLILTFEAAVDQAFQAEPGQIVLQDADGYLYRPSYVPRPAGAMPPDLQSQTLAPYDRISGSIGYVLPTDRPVARVIYRGDGSRLITIRDQAAEETAAPGSPRTVRTAAGVDAGTVTVREVADPFVDHDPTRPPAEGQRYVLVTVAFEASDAAPLWADPAGLLLVDDKGILYPPAWVPRKPDQLMQDLDRQALSPTDRVSGVVGYAVPSDAVVRSIVYAPEADRFITVADLTAGG